MAIARVQAFGSGTTTGASLTTAVNLTGVTVGNGLIVCIGENVLSVGTISGVSDTVNTYAQATGASNISGGNCRGDLWYCKQVTTGGSLTLTVTGTVSGGIIATVIEVSGQDTATFIDKVISANGNSTAPNSGATASTSAASEFVVGFCNVKNAVALATSPTFSTSLTSQTTETLANNTTTADKGSLSVFDGLLAASAVAETFSATSTSNPWVAICATFKGAPPPPAPIVIAQSVNLAATY